MTENQKLNQDKDIPIRAPIACILGHIDHGMKYTHFEIFT